MSAPIVIDGADADNLWTQAVEAVLDGDCIEPRGLPTRELTSVVLHLRDVRQRLVTSPVRRVNPAFAVADAVWVLAAAPDSWIFAYNRRLERFTDDGQLRGAYGPRLRRWRGQVDQLDEVWRRLLVDASTRQAVVQIYDPSLDRMGHRDIACTLGWRFLLRERGLRMHSSMRSNDLWLGFPYDVFTATVVQEVLAGWLNAPLASFVQFTDSLHLYEHDLALVERGPVQPRPGPGEATLGPLGVPHYEFAELLERLVGDDPVRGWGGWDDVSRILRLDRAHREGRSRDAVVLADGIEGAIAAVVDRWYEGRQ